MAPSAFCTSALSTPRTRIRGKPRCDWVNLCALRQGKPQRYQARRKSSCGNFGIVRATVPFHGEHDALEPTKEGLRFSTVRLPTPRCVCVSVNLFSLSLARSLRLLRLRVLLLRDPLVQAGVE